MRKPKSKMFVYYKIICSKLKNENNCNEYIICYTRIEYQNKYL